jgi:SAM-dependent methyltransferase
MNDGRDPSWIWSRYWGGGQRECCVGGQVLDLSGFWRARFASFADGAKLLDLATGAGQVTEFAMAAGEEMGRAFSVVGVDVADIPPAPKNARVRGTARLIGNTPLESLPFADATYDGITSQFGIEYADRAKAVAEAARVLKPGGRGAFVLHHAEGAIGQDCAARLAAFASVVGEGAAFRAAERVFTLHREGAPIPQLREAESRLRDAVMSMRLRLGAQPDENLAEIVGFLLDLAREPARYDPADALRRLAAAEDDLLGWRLRQQAQLAAALTAADVEALRALMTRAGLDAAPAETLAAPGGETVAWVLSFTKPAQIAS